MANHAPKLGNIIYTVEDGNTFTFPGDCNTTIKSKPIKTSDGRTTKAVEHTMTVSGWIYSSDLVSSSGTCDNAFAQTRKILSQAGGQLTITGKGFGDYNINRNTGIERDIAFGPHPEIVTWKPFGNVTCQFEWVVVFTLPWKDTAYTKAGILEYTWETRYEYDAEGFCDRTVTAEMEIAGSRFNQGVTSVPDYSNIEKYMFDYIFCDCPLGFHRTGHEITINKARTKASVVFKDEQDRGLTYPPGIAEMDIVHEMSSQGSGMTLANWNWVISITATPEAKYGSSYGYEACLAAHQSRFLYLVRNLVNSNGVLVPLPLGFKITERVNRRSTTLVASWLIMSMGNKNNKSFTPVDILARSGLWQPFDEWSAKDHKVTADGPQGPNTTGGFTKMMSDLRQNIIIDVSSLIPKIPDIGLASGRYKLATPPDADTLILSPIGQYIEFKAWIQGYQTGGFWINYPLSKNPDGPDVTAPGRWRQEMRKFSKFYFVGYIVRVGVPAAAIPVIKTIGGIQVQVPAGEEQRVRTRPVLNNLGMVIWRTDFWVPYIPVRPDGTPLEEHPLPPPGEPPVPPGWSKKLDDDSLLQIPGTINV